MKHITLRYVSGADLDEKLSNVKKEYSAGGYNSILFHIYCGVYDPELMTAVAGKIHSDFDTDCITGSMAAGEIKNGKLMDRGILISVMMFNSSEVKVYRFRNVNGNEAEVGDTICKVADGIGDIKAMELVLPGTKLHTKALMEELSKCRRDVQFFGGYAGGHSWDTDESYVFDHEGVYDDMIQLVTYSGEELHVSVDRSVGWQTLGVIPFKVTKADEKRLIAVDGRPAAELYRKYMQIEADEHFTEETFEFPLMAELDGEKLLRHIISLEDDGTLVMAGYVTEGMDIYLSYGVPADIVEMVNDRLKYVCEFRPEAILLYSCLVRKSFWEDFVNIEMQPFQEIAETAGFHTWGEMQREKKNGNVLEYNITLMSIVMREGEPKGEIKHVHVDDSVLKGQASLVKRLTKLVSATSGELHKAYSDLTILNEKLQQMADHDGLTKILNRRKIEQMIDEQFDKVKYANVISGLIMLDIDFFKKINDNYGHAVGDKALVDIAKIMDDAISDIDGAYVGRWGGEEFMMIVPGYDSAEIYELGERIRRRIEAYDFGIPRPITASLGVLSFDSAWDKKMIYVKVDDALYKAKAAGRNLVVRYG